jgi:hypothetical protein
MPKQIDYSNRSTPVRFAKGTGTVYTMTAAAAAIVFGTTSPAITLPEKGTWLIEAEVQYRYEGATFAAARTVTLKLRRTNNTAADIGDDGTKTMLTGITTTITDAAMQVYIPPTPYTTTAEDDAVTLFSDVSVLPSAGTFTVVDAWIRATKVSD